MSYFENRTGDLENALANLLEHFEPGDDGASYTLDNEADGIITVNENLAVDLDHARAVLYDELVDETDA